MKLDGVSAGRACPGASLRTHFLSQASRLALRSTFGAVVVAGSALFIPTSAEAACTFAGLTVQCGDTSTINTQYPNNRPDDRFYYGATHSPIQLAIDPGAAVSGFGLAITNNGDGGIAVVNSGTVSVDAGLTPTAGGTAAVSVTVANRPITYTGGFLFWDGAAVAQLTGAVPASLTLGKTLTGTDVFVT